MTAAAKSQPLEKPVGPLKETGTDTSKPVKPLKRPVKTLNKPGAPPARAARLGKVTDLPVTAHAVPRAAAAPAKSAPKPTLATRKKSVAPHPNSDQPIRIFQIFYDDWHEQLLDPEFEPYDNRGIQSELFEFEVFEKLAQSKRTSGAEYWGALSWRFSEKTGMSGKELLAAIAANPGYDVYYCNPFPANEAVYHNTWIQGEPSHPSFLALAQSFFEAAGLPVAQLKAIQVSDSFSASNYLIGKPAFWDAYLLFVRRALGNAERRMPANMRALLHSKIADQHSFHFGATYVPFIVERLLGTFLATDGAGLKAFKLALPAREKELNVHQRLLREMKDVAHKTKSNWLAAIWINYRALYLSQTNGREWCQKYLRSITPAEVKFG